MECKECGRTDPHVHIDANELGKLLSTEPVVFGNGSILIPDYTAFYQVLERIAVSAERLVEAIETVSGAVIEASREP